MQIWIDADACPSAIKYILFRAAERVQVRLTLVANQPVATQPSARITSLQVRKGFDAADNEIVRRLESGDLVITADIPLAAEVIAKGGFALNPLSELHTEANIHEPLNLRDFMETLRASGIQTGGPNALNPRDRQALSNAMDRLLARNCRLD